MAALAAMRKIVGNTARPRSERKFAAETARALLLSTSALGKSKRSKKSNGSRKGPNVQASGSGVRLLKAPVATAPFGQRMAVGLPDTTVDVGYDLADITTNVTTGTALTDVFTFLTSAPTFISQGLIPIVPADMSSIASSQGFGTDYMNNFMKYFARVRYEKIELHLYPWGAGASTTTGSTVVVAPFRGGVGGTGAALSNSGTANPYQVSTISASSQQPFSVSRLLPAKGSVVIPTWQPAVIDLTPYIGGGSGPKQNEFAVQASNTLFTTSNRNILNSANIPCCIAIGGATTATLTNVFQTLMQVVVRCRMTLLDFNPITSTAPGLAPVGVDRKDKKSPCVPPLDFRSALMRSDAPASPTQSLLGSELRVGHIDAQFSRARSEAIPIPAPAAESTQRRK